MHYQASRASLPQIAQELGVDAIVEGSVVRQGDEVRITAQLIRASNDTHVWAKTYQRTTRDFMSLQAEVAAGIAENVTTALTGTPDGYLRRTPPLEAYEAYIKARASKVELTGSSLRQALALYQRAIDIDSQYAAAYTGMAETYDALGTVGMMPAGEAVRLTREYAQKAVALEDSEAEAHATLGELAMMDWNWEAA
jgi:tetratricopeptide (TPR) repeat protein